MSETTGTTTVWRDVHSGVRGHELMTKEQGEKIPTLYGNENVPDYDDVLAPVKLFSPYSGWTWYITEWQAETGLCFDLTELADATVFGGVPAVERDLYWQSKTIGEIRRVSS